MTELPRHIVGVAVIALCTAMIAALFFVEIPEGNRDIAMVLLGIGMGWGGAVVQFHFGSSEGSKRKDRRPQGTPADPVHVEEDL